MKKIVIDFDDVEEAMLALKSQEMSFIITDMLEELRRRRKYHDCEVSEEIEKLFYEYIEGRGLSSLIY